MAIPVPASRLRRYLRTTAPYEIAGVVGPLVALVPSAFRFFADGRAAWGYYTLAGAMVLCLIAGAKQLAAWREYTRRDDLHELAGCLHTLYAVLLSDYPDDRDPRLRLTIHVPVDGGQHLMQVLDYVGDDRGGHTANRRFPIQSGITGRAFREGEMFVASRENDDYESYVQELVRLWSFTEGDARETDPATMAWLAIPLIDISTNLIEGVLYADSTDRAFFTESRQVLALHAAAGIAIFVGRRYSSK
jgi:hypothetical protein